MQYSELATQLVVANEPDRKSLLETHSELANVQLAYAIKDICLDAWSSEPNRALAADSCLHLLRNNNADPEIIALSEWTSGLRALIEGRMEDAVRILSDAFERFTSLGKPHVASATQVSKLIALAMLGRYEEAIECGLRARDVFLSFGDKLAAGKIEHNIGNLYFRRDQYRHAEQFQSSARERFTELNDIKQLATINNCLANTHALLHEFTLAEQLLNEARQQAEEAQLPVTLAEIEGNLGTFALLQGRYDGALDYLERSRRRYESLGMPHQSAIAELEIADAYLELNLFSEAANIYDLVIPKFAELGMRAEHARALAYCGRAKMMLGRYQDTHCLLIDARNLYAAEGNSVGEAIVALALAHMAYREGEYEKARETASEAESCLRESGGVRRFLIARWLQGEAARAQGEHETALVILTETLHQATGYDQPQIAERCHTSLGLLASARGDVRASSEAFKQAIRLIEELRAPLPGEEFRAAYFSDKLVPYAELARLSLAGGAAGNQEALEYFERSRARSLVEVVGGNFYSLTEPKDDYEAQQLHRLDELRHELNYLYNQITRPSSIPLPQNDVVEIQKELQRREHEISKILRQVHQRGRFSFSPSEAWDLPALQRSLGKDKVVVEYATLDDEVLALVISQTAVEVVRNLGSEKAIAKKIAQLRFQIDSMRYGAAQIRRHLDELTRRTKHHLLDLYHLLIRPLEGLIGNQGLIIVPHRTLHYLPFHALHDGSGYLIEARSISYAPSAFVLQQCLARGKPGEFNSALLFAVTGEETLRVREEVAGIVPLFKEAAVFLDNRATGKVLKDRASSVDVLHLACHGQFRPDNPLFSVLQLGDGWLTVGDAYQLNLRNALVTLSACETGMSEIAPGDELIGLGRGFFAAGASSLLISLWNVDDETTSEFMREFYRLLLHCGSPANALQHAQLRIMATKPHPFFWSPFVLVGRW